jgi:hypothetical protein
VLHWVVLVRTEKQLSWHKEIEVRLRKTHNQISVFLSFAIWSSTCSLVSVVRPMVVVRLAASSKKSVTY